MNQTEQSSKRTRNEKERKNSSSSQLFGVSVGQVPTASLSSSSSSSFFPPFVAWFNRVIENTPRGNSFYSHKRLNGDFKFSCFSDLITRCFRHAVLRKAAEPKQNKKLFKYLSIKEKKTKNYNTRENEKGPYKSVGERKKTSARHMACLFYGCLKCLYMYTKGPYQHVAFPREIRKKISLLLNNFW